MANFKVDLFDRIEVDPKAKAKKIKVPQSEMTQTTETERKIDFLQALTVGVLIAVALGFITLLFAYFQMVKDSFRDYRSVIDEFNNERYSRLESKVDKLEDNSQELQIKVESIDTTSSANIDASPN